MILYPAIDILDGKAVRLQQGEYDQETTYDDDPVDAAKRWADGGAEYIHVVDLDGAREGDVENLATIERITAAVDCPIEVGGGLRSPIWAQTLTDITGRAQLIPEQAIGASYGDALLAAIGVGLVPRDTDWARIEREIEPNPLTRNLYDDLYETWRELYPATREQVHRLADPRGH